MASVLWLKLKRMRNEVFMYVIMLGMALALTFVFSGAVFGGESTQRIYVVNEDTSAVTESFLENIDSSAYSLETEDTGNADIAVAKGEVLAAIVIPEGFGDALKKGDASITLIKSADSPDIMALSNVLNAAASKTSHVYSLSDTLTKTLDPLNIDTMTTDEVAKAYNERMGKNAAVQVTTEMLGTDDYDWKYQENVHFLMGFNLFFVMFSIVFTIASILEDKKFGTWNRIRITPLSSSSIFAGNMIPTFLVGVAQMAIVVFSGEFLFGIHLGTSLGSIFVVLIMFALTTTCLGLLLATAFGTYEQLNAATPVILVASSMLGGCMWPLSIVPKALQSIARITPQYWALSATEDLAINGGGLNTVSTHLIVLAGMALLFFALSVVFYRKRQRV